MNLTLKRRPSGVSCTIGELFENEEHECFTLEDIVREVPGKPVSEWKIGGETAIPSGRYKITVTHSLHFNRDLPLLNGVPGFLGVRIHSGNTDADTEGCILVGRSLADEAIMQSRLAFDQLFEKIRDALDASEEVWISIVNADEGIKS